MTQNGLKVQKAKERVDFHFRLHYNISLNDTEISDTPGYWRERKDCNYPNCHAPIHGFLFNNKAMKHTVTYRDNIRDAKGRFASPYRTWRLLKAETQA